MSHARQRLGSSGKLIYVEETIADHMSTLGKVKTEDALPRP